MANVARIAVVCGLLALAVACGRTSIARAPRTPYYSSASECSIGVFDSFEGLVLVSQAVIVTELAGAPVEREFPAGGATTTTIHEDYTATVEEYLKGTGPPTITFSEPKRYRVVLPSGDAVDSPACAYGQLQMGHKYVLFLDRIPGGPWVLTVPMGFEITNSGALQSIDQGGYTVTPGSWDIPALDDFKAQLRDILARTATPEPDETPTSAAPDVVTETSVPPETTTPQTTTPVETVPGSLPQ
jgi:hypothetical protein